MTSRVPSGHDDRSTRSVTSHTDETSPLEVSVSSWSPSGSSAVSHRPGSWLAVAIAADTAVWRRVTSWNPILLVFSHLRPDPRDQQFPIGPIIRCTYRRVSVQFSAVNSLRESTALRSRHQVQTPSAPQVPIRRSLGISWGFGATSSQDVSAGTFTDPTHVELTVGIARRDYRNVWVTLRRMGVDAGGFAVLRTHDT